MTPPFRPRTVTDVPAGAAAPGWGLLAALIVLSLALAPSTRLYAQETDLIPDASAKYHFLSANDTLGILEEEGRIKGYLDVAQGEDESDAVLTYNITTGSRQKNHVEFKTSKIHQRYYRFSGTVGRGGGRNEGDPDYLRLTGDLEVVTASAESGKESVERQHVVLKSFGKNERPDDSAWLRASLREGLLCDRQHPN